MYNINNLMAIEVDKQIIKFESLIVYNNFIALRNEITFKDIEKEKERIKNIKWTPEMLKE